MWTLNKPELNDAISDIDTVILHCSALIARDKKALANLYTQYDSNKGYVTDSEYNNIPKGKANGLKTQYSKTGINKDLHYIRKELFTGISKCPFCSINEPSQLDHYMPQSKYPALSVLRLNLVPLCGICNQKKRDDSYGNYVHPYYQQFPAGKMFFIAQITVKGKKISVQFDIDQRIITDVNLFNKLKKQIAVLDLDGRISKQVNCFLAELLSSIFNSNEHLENFLKNRLGYYENNYKKNDWRCAVIRGMVNCPAFDFTVANNCMKSYAVNNDAGA